MTAKRSIRELERQCKKEPDNLVARLLLAAAYREAGRTADAVALYRSVAASYQQQGRRTQAVAVLRSLLEIDPDDRDSRALLDEIDRDGGTPSIPPPFQPPAHATPDLGTPPPALGTHESPRPPTLPPLDQLRPSATPRKHARVLHEDVVLRELTPVRPPGVPATVRPTPTPEPQTPATPATAPSKLAPKLTPKRIAGLSAAAERAARLTPGRGSGGFFTPTPLPTPVPFHDADSSGEIEALSSRDLQEVPEGGDGGDGGEAGDDDARTRIAHDPAADPTGRRLAVPSRRATTGEQTSPNVDISADLDTRRVRRLSEAEVAAASQPPPGQTNRLARLDSADLDVPTNPEASPLGIRAGTEPPTPRLEPRREPAASPPLLDHALDEDEVTRYAGDDGRPTNDFDATTDVRGSSAPSQAVRAPTTTRTIQGVPPARARTSPPTGAPPSGGTPPSTAPRGGAPTRTAPPPRPEPADSSADDAEPTRIAPDPARRPRLEDVPITRDTAPITRDTAPMDPPPNLGPPRVSPPLGTPPLGAKSQKHARPGAPPPRAASPPPRAGTPPPGRAATAPPRAATPPPHRPAPPEPPEPVDDQGEATDVADTPGVRASAPGMHRSRTFATFGSTLDEMDPLGAAIDAPLDVFSMLPPEALNELGRRMILRRFAPGDVIIREGDPGDACYIIVDGEVRVLKNDPLRPDAGPVEVARLGNRALFGEFALLADRRRHATVQATAHCDLYEIPRQLLRELAASFPDVGPLLEGFYRQRLLATLLRTAPFFAPLPEEQRGQLLARFRPLRADSGESIVREGQPAGGLYLIVIGAVEITRRLGKHRSVILATLREGAYFGEMSLLSGGAATATVVAAGPVELALLPPRDFYEIVSTHPQLWAAIRREARTRALENARLLAGETGTV